MEESTNNIPIESLNRSDISSELNITEINKRNDKKLYNNVKKFLSGKGLSGLSGVVGEYFSIKFSDIIQNMKNTEFFDGGSEFDKNVLLLQCISNTCEQTLQVLRNEIKDLKQTKHRSGNRNKINKKIKKKSTLVKEYREIVKDLHKKEKKVYKEFKAEIESRAKLKGGVLPSRFHWIDRRGVKKQIIKSEENKLVLNSYRIDPNGPRDIHCVNCFSDEFLFTPYSVFGINKRTTRNVMREFREPTRWHRFWRRSLIITANAATLGFINISRRYRANIKRYDKIKELKSYGIKFDKNDNREGKTELYNLLVKETYFKLCGNTNNNSISNKNILKYSEIVSAFLLQKDILERIKGKDGEIDSGVVEELGLVLKEAKFTNIDSAILANNLKASYERASEISTKQGLKSFVESFKEVTSVLVEDRAKDKQQDHHLHKSSASDPAKPSRSHNSTGINTNVVLDPAKPSRGSKSLEVNTVETSNSSEPSHGSKSPFKDRGAKEVKSADAVIKPGPIPPQTPITTQIGVERGGLGSI